MTAPVEEDGLRKMISRTTNAYLGYTPSSQMTWTSYLFLVTAVAAMFSVALAMDSPVLKILLE